MGADTHGEPFYTAQNCAKCGGTGIIKGGRTDSRNDSLCTCNTTQIVTQSNKIASFEDACEAIAKKNGFSSWTELKTEWLKRTRFASVVHENYVEQIAYLYAESKARDAWSRACEAQKKLCAENATIESDASYDFDVDKDSILNAPKPEYKP